MLAGSLSDAIADEIKAEINRLAAMPSAVLQNQREVLSLQVRGLRNGTGLSPLDTLMYEFYQIQLSRINEAIEIQRSN